MAGNKRGRRRRLRMAVIVGLVIVAAVAGFLAYRGLKSNTAAEVSYTTAVVQKMTLTSSVSGTGSVELSQTVAVQPEVSGTVSGLAVKVGDAVEAGQLLLTIVNPELDLAVTKAEITYQEALLGLEKAKLSVLQAKQDLADLQEQYEAQSTTTTTSTTLPVSSTTSTHPAPSTTTSSSTTTTATLPTDTSSTTSTTGVPPSTTGVPPSTTVLDSRAAALLAASSSAAASSQFGQATSNSGSSSSAKITELDIKAAKQAVESAELSVTSAEFQVTSAELALQEAKENAAKREVRAPIAGVVTALTVENGDTIGQGGSTSGGGGTATGTSSSSSGGSSSSSGGVVTITDPDAFTVKVALSESDIPAVKVGQKATISFDALPDLTLTGKVTSIDLAGTNTQGVVSYGVVVTPDVTDPAIKAGMTATVNIITQVAADVLAVPSSAVKSQGNTKYVQVLENGVPVNVTVEVGISAGSYVEIKSGLTEGQEVVVQTITSGSATTTTIRNRTGGIFNEGGGFPGGAVPGGFVPGVR